MSPGKRILLIFFSITLVICPACGRSAAVPPNPPADADVPPQKTPAAPVPPASDSLGSPVAQGESNAVPGIFYPEPDIGKLSRNLPAIDGSVMTLPITEGIYEDILGMAHDTAAKAAVHSGSGGAYKRLASGAADLIFVNRPSKEDKEIISSLGCKLAFIPIARDGLVFVVNPVNELRDITVQSIHDIYSGKITSWKNLTKSDSKITAFQNPSNSYMQTLLLDLVMGDTAPMIPPMRKVTTGQQIVADVVSSYNNAEDAIGFSSYYYHMGSYGAADQRMLAVDGVLPDTSSISNGSYPLCCDIYAVISADKKKSDEVSTLISWLISGAGQAMIADNGYIPLYMPDTEVTP